jgi:hypothetical protein
MCAGLESTTPHTWARFVDGENAENPTMSRNPGKIREDVRIIETPRRIYNRGM